MPREKLEQKGVSALSDTDLVSVLISSGVEGKSVFEVSRSVSRLISDQTLVHGRTCCIASARQNITWRNFTNIRGVGKVKAMQLECAIELGKRFMGIVNTKRPIIRGRSDVLAVCSYLKGRKQEHVVVLGLNARNELIGKRTVAIGSLNKAIVEPREIFGWAVAEGVAGVILVHNHPSGGAQPSDADVAFTARMKKAAELLGLEFIDHVIVA